MQSAKTTQKRGECVSREAISIILFTIRTFTNLFTYTYFSVFVPLYYYHGSHRRRTHSRGIFLNCQRMNSIQLLFFYYCYPHSIAADICPENLGKIFVHHHQPSKAHTVHVLVFSFTLQPSSSPLLLNSSVSCTC